MPNVTRLRTPTQRRAPAPRTWIRANSGWLTLTMVSLALHGCFAVDPDLLRRSSGDSGTPDGFVPGCGFCPPFTGSFPFDVTPCCTAEFTCGFIAEFVSIGCLPPDAPGVPDPACTVVRSGGQEIPGCCTPSGWCGLQMDEVGLGCVRRTQLAEDPILGVSPIDVPCLGLTDIDAGSDVGELFCERAVSDGRCDPIAICEAQDRHVSCTCPSGYADLSPMGTAGQTCLDINECLGAPPCPEGRCVNTPGSYRCDPLSP